jgi:hypothetical protein
MNFNLLYAIIGHFAENKNYLSLQQNGRLTDYTAYTNNRNVLIIEYGFILFMVVCLEANLHFIPQCCCLIKKLIKILWYSNWFV